jgi:hypothetical protein
MWANRSGIQGETVGKIGLAWVLTLPAAILLSATLFGAGGFLIPAARSSFHKPASPKLGVTSGAIDSAASQVASPHPDKGAADSSAP